MAIASFYNIFGSNHHPRYRSQFLFCLQTNQITTFVVMLINYSTTEPATLPLQVTFDGVTLLGGRGGGVIGQFRLLGGLPPPQTPPST